MPWQDEVRPGDIVLFSLPEKNPTRFGQLVLYFQNIVKAPNRKTHASMVVDAGDTKPKIGEMSLKLIDIEFGRKASTYFIPRQYGDIDIYRLFNSQQSYTSPDGDARTASSADISAKAAQIAMEYIGASYSIRECLSALSIHKTSQEHLINDQYLAWLQAVDKNSPFMCVSFVLSCYQKACMEILGGLPPAFHLNAHSTPRYFAHYIETSGHFTALPRATVREILATGAPVYRAAAPSRFSWLRRRKAQGGDYDPLLEDSEDNEPQDNGAGLGFSP